MGNIKSDNFEDRVQTMHRIIDGKGLSDGAKEDLEMLIGGEMPVKKQQLNPDFLLAARFLNKSYYEIQVIAERQGEELFNSRLRDQGDQLENFLQANRGLNDSVLLPLRHDYYLSGYDKGAHYLLEVKTGKKSQVSEDIKNFDFKIPVIIAEMPGDRSSLDVSSEPYDPKDDCTSDEFDMNSDFVSYQNELDHMWELKEAMQAGEQNVLFSDDPAALTLREFAEQTPELMDAAWHMGFGTQYMEHKDCPHYHVTARPGNYDAVCDAMKEFKSEFPVIVTEMKFWSYVAKIRPKNE